MNLAYVQMFLRRRNETETWTFNVQHKVRRSEIYGEIISEKYNLQKLVSQEHFNYSKNLNPSECFSLKIAAKVLKIFK